jgi:hypothetical protein
MSRILQQTRSILRDIASFVKCMSATEKMQAPLLNNIG